MTMTTKELLALVGKDVAALYVDAKGPYPSIRGVDCWDEVRDARLYAGPHPVIAHPPCGRWCGMARMNERRWGAKVGDDGGCFESALAAVRAWGGVLEHPARSIAWTTYGLQKPSGAAWTQAGEREWVGEVWQSAYGHKATKRTWLLYVGDYAPADFSPLRPRGAFQIGGGIHTGNRSLPRLEGKETHLTPKSFAHYLVALARDSSAPIATALCAEVEALRKDAERLRELAEVADNIISVCGGDAWERECTESERAEYARLRAELFPQPEEFPAYWPLGNHRPQPTPCELCGCMLKTEEGRRQHLRDKHLVPWEATKYEHSAPTKEPK